jgi:hypothetical protein
MTRTACLHHYVLNVANEGKCKKCGAKRAFTGGIDYSPMGIKRAAVRGFRHAPYDDDGVRGSDLSHFRQSFYEGA